MAATPRPHVFARIIVLFALMVLAALIVRNSQNSGLNSNTNPSTPSLQDFLSSDSRFTALAASSSYATAEVTTGGAYTFLVAQDFTTKAGGWGTISNATDATAYWRTHTLPQALSYSDLVIKSSSKNRNDSLLWIWESGTNKYINNSRVVTTDVQVREGIVHILDTSLSPGDFNDLLGTLTHNSELAAYANLFKTAGLSGLLANPQAQLTLLLPPLFRLNTLASAQLSTALRKSIVPEIISQKDFASQFESLAGDLVQISPSDIQNTVRASNGIIYFLK